MADGSDDDDGEADGDEDGEDARPAAASDGKKYVVPKHVPALCPDDEVARAENEREGESKAKKQKLSRAIMEDLKRQYLDTPEEEFNHSDHLKAKQLADMRERTR